MADTIYAFGKATPVADKNAFYDLVGQARNSGISNDQIASQFSNNPYGVSYQELYGPTQAATSISAPARDPYASFGGVAGLNTAKQNIFNAASTGADASANNYGNSVYDLVHGAQTQQNAINDAGAQNELAKLQGTQGVLGMVNRGIKSGGVTLANKNAADSSAAGALANAYGDIGQRELSKVGNQYGLQNEALNKQQTALTEQLQHGVGVLSKQKDQVVNDLVNKARESIAALNAEMATAGVGDRINLEQEAARIKNDLLGKLQQYDQQLAATSNIRGNDQAARLTEAQRLASLGKAATNPYQFTTEAPLQAQNGPTAGTLPLFTFNRNRQQG